LSKAVERVGQKTTALRESVGETWQKIKGGNEPKKLTPQREPLAEFVEPEYYNRFAPNSEIAEKAALQFDEILKKGSVGENQAPAIQALVHESGIVTVSVSGSKSLKIFNRIKDFLPDNFKFGMKKLEIGLEEIEHPITGKNYASADCCEISGYSQAGSNPSPVVNGAVLWRGTKPNPYPIEPGSRFMNPCPSCRFNEPRIVGGKKVYGEQ
jgi:hypothetical protein